MANPLRYTYPADNIAKIGTCTLVTGTQSAGTAPRDYLPGRLFDDDPAHPFKTDSTTFRILWDFGSALTAAVVALIHHNFAAALTNVKFAMGTTTATTDFSATFVIPAYHEDKFPVNCFLDLSGTSPSYRYASLEATTANAVACSIGECPIYNQIRSLPGSFLISTDVDDEDHPLVEHKTDVGVSTIYRHGTRLRWLRGDVVEEASTGVQIRSWNRATLGRGLPFLLLPPVELNAGEPLFVRWEDNKLPRNYMERGISKFKLGFEEISRGLYPTPSAV